MTAAITQLIDDSSVLALLDRLAGVGSDAAWRGFLLGVGEDLVESSKARFVSSTAPDGTPWAPNTQATFDAYLARISGSYDKAGKRTGDKKGYFDQGGRLAAKGSAAIQGKKPLIGESRALSTTIYYRVEGDALLVGSPLVYSAMQQFGGTKADFPNLWGDIPARPFLGISASDAAGIESAALDYLESLVEG